MRNVVDWPDSTGNWWNNRASYPCRISQDSVDGGFYVGSEQSGDDWVGRKEWEFLVGPTRWVKLVEENPLPTAW